MVLATLPMSTTGLVVDTQTACKARVHTFVKSCPSGMFVAITKVPTWGSSANANKAGAITSLPSPQ